jgi:Immunoglobulin I-set domain/SprB repeat
MNKFTVQGSNNFLGLLCCLFFCCFLPKNTSAQVSITTQPANSAVCVGATAQFSVVAVGVGTATVVGYQWYKNNVLIPSAISSTYTTPATVGSDDNDQYTVEVECSCGSFTMSSAATLTVNQAAVITSGPFLNQNKCEGESITLSVTAVGTITGYQWKKGTTDLMGQTGPSLTLNNLAAADAGQYSVEARAACGNESYGPIDLTINLKPIITTQPAGATKCVGETFTTSVSANNAGSFQWYRDGNPVANGAGGGGSTISGATTSTLTISNLCATCNPGSYTVQVFGSGACGGQSVTSSAAVLNINEPTDITSGSFLNQNKCVGDNLSLSVTATGTPTLSFQWQKGGVNVGTNSNTISISNLATTDAGSYSVTATNSCGSDTYGPIVLTVNSKPTISVQPVGATKCVGDNYSLSVTAANAGSYQWQKDGATVSTANPFNINNIQTTAAGTYRVIVNGAGACAAETVTSTSVVLNVNSPVVVVSQPVAQTVCEGATVVFSVGLGGTLTGVQWYKNGVAIGGATSGSYSLATTVANNGDKYKVELFGPCGNLMSNEVLLTVNSKPTISVQPVGATKCVGDNYSLSVTAANAGSYQWQKDGATVSTANPFNINNIQTTAAGTYRVIVNGAGACAAETVTSTSVVLNVNSPVVVVSQPVAQTVCEGATVVFSVGLGGTLTGVQWYKNGVAIGGATSGSYSLATTVANNGDKYKVELFGPCGNLMSNEVLLTVNSKPTISVQPVGATKCVGDNYSLSVTAANAGSYQWQKDGATVSTANPFNINNIQTTAAGTYRVIVNGAGACAAETVTSTSVVLNVNSPVVVVSQPVAQTVCEGATVVFSVGLGGTLTGVQWYKNGVAIGGATSGSYSLATTVANNGDKYKVELFGPCGNLMSNEVLLTVNSKPTISVQPVGATKCVGDNYSLSVTAANAGSYQWQKDGATVSTANPFNINNIQTTTAGTYRVIVNGAGACAAETVTSTSVVLNVNSPVVVARQPVAQTICETDGVGFATVASGTITGYQWYKNGVAIGGATSGSYSFATTIANNGDKYKVEIAGPCGNVMSNEVVLNITRVEPPTIATNKPNGMCTGEQTTLTATGCAGTVTWFRDGNTVTNGATYTTSAVGNYTTKCTNLGCTSLTFSNALTVVQQTELVFTTKITNVTCFDGNDGEIILTPAGSAGEPYTVVWKTPNTSNVKISNLIAGEYPVTITDKIGCKIDRSVTVKQPIKARVNISTTDITCFAKGDGKISFGGGVSDNGGFQFVINNSNPTPFTNADSHIITALNKGTYTVSVVDSKKCVALAPVQVTIVEPAAINVSLVAAKDPRSFDSKDGSIQVRVVGGITPYNYQWFNEAGGAINDNVFNTATGTTIVPIDGGNYKIVVKDKNGCEQPFSQTLITPKRIEIVNKIDSITCFGKNDGKSAVTITGGVTTSTQLPYKTVWNKVNADGTKTRINADVLSVASLLPGTYEIVATDANDIVRTTSFTLTDPAELKTNINKIVGNHCASTPLGELYFDIVGGRKPYKVTWNNSSVIGTSITKIPAGNQNVFVTDASGCQNSVNALVPDETQSFKVNVSYVEPTCFGRCDAKLTSVVAGGFTPYQYDWTNLNTNQANLTGVCGKSETVLTIKDNKGCILKSSSVTLTTPAPRALGLEKEKEVCPSKVFELNATSVTWGKTFSWTLPNGQSKSGAIIQGDTIGIYKLTVLDENSCGGQDIIAVVANKNVKQLFTVPSEAVINKSVVAIDLTQPIPTSVKWEFVGGTLVSEDNIKLKVRFANVGKYKIKESATVDNCVYTLIKEVEIKATIDNKGFPEPVGFNSFGANILGNPANGGRIGIDVTNEDNEPFTISISSTRGTLPILQKEFIKNGSNAVYIDLPDSITEGEYILNIYTPTAKISKKIFIVR